MHRFHDGLLLPSVDNRLLKRSSDNLNYYTGCAGNENCFIHSNTTSTQ